MKVFYAESNIEYLSNMFGFYKNLLIFHENKIRYIKGQRQKNKHIFFRSSYIIQILSAFDKIPVETLKVLRNMNCNFTSLRLKGNSTYEGKGIFVIQLDYHRPALRSGSKIL